MIIDAQVLENNLLLAEAKNESTYKFWVAQHITHLNDVTKNQIKATVKKKMLQKEEKGFLYSVEISDRLQINTEGMLGLENALAFLQNNLVLYTNDHGEIISIANRGELKNTWLKEQKNIIKEFGHLLPDKKGFSKGMNSLLEDDDSLVKFIQKTEIYSLLFPSVYNYQLMQKINVDQQKDFYSFFDSITLPLAIKTTLHGIHKETRGKQIIRSGKIDRARFNKKAATNFFAESYGVHEYGIKFNASYLETFDLNQKNEIDKANTMLNVAVKSLYQLKQISKLIKKEL